MASSPSPSPSAPTPRGRFGDYDDAVSDCSPSKDPVGAKEPSSLKRTPGSPSPSKPAIAAKPSRKLAPPPPPPKPAPLKNSSPKSTLTRNTTVNHNTVLVDSFGTANGEYSENSSLQTRDGDTTASEEAGPQKVPPPLPISPPPIQRKGPLPFLNPAALLNSCKSQEINQASEIKSSSTSVSPTPLQVSEENGTLCRKTPPSKGPKPVIPPKSTLLVKKKLDIVNSPPNNKSIQLGRQNNRNPEAEVSPHDKSSKQVEIKVNQECKQDERTPCNSSECSVNSVHKEIYSDPGREKPSSPVPSNHDSTTLLSDSQLSTFPSVSHELVTKHSVTEDAELPASQESVGKSSPVAPPPLPKNPPRGGLPRKARSSISKTPPVRPAPPKVRKQTALEQQQIDATVTSGCINSVENNSVEDKQSNSGDHSQETTLPEAPKPRPRTRLSFPRKSSDVDLSLSPADLTSADSANVRHTENDSNSLNLSIGKEAEGSSLSGDNGGENLESAPSIVSKEDHSSVCDVDGESEELENTAKYDVNPSGESHASTQQPEIELDYVEVYRGEDGEKILGTPSFSSAAVANHEEQESCKDFEVDPACPPTTRNSIDIKEPESTCGMLKEIEDFLKKKFVDFDSTAQESDFDIKNKGESFSKNSPAAQAVSVDTSPVRPPRPKHQASQVRRRQGSLTSLTKSDSSQISDADTPPSTGAAKKICPPKPKRMSLPRVSRSYSDASDLRSPVDSDPSYSKNLNITPTAISPHQQSNSKPYLPPRLESLRKGLSLDSPVTNTSSDSESPPPLPPRNRNNTVGEIPAPPIPERISLISPAVTEKDSELVPQSRCTVDMKPYKNSSQSSSSHSISSAGKLEDSNVTVATLDKSMASSPSGVSGLRPVRKAPPPPPLVAPRRAATFGPGDTSSIVPCTKSMELEDSANGTEPDYHEIPPEGLAGVRNNVQPKLTPRVSRSASLNAGSHNPEQRVIELRNRHRKSSSLERQSSVEKAKDKKEEQQKREKKAKTALIQRVTQGLGLRKNFKKSKSPESTSSKTSESCDSSELEMEDSNKTDNDVDTRQNFQQNLEAPLSYSNHMDGRNSSTDDTGITSTAQHSGHDVALKVDVTESGEKRDDKDLDAELASPAMEDLGIEDLENEVMSALNSSLAGAGSMTGSNGALDNSGDISSGKDRPVSFASHHSNSTSSDHEAGDEDGVNAEEVSSASDSDSEPEQDKEEIYAIRKAKKVFFIAKEIMSSESVFVDVLKLLNVDLRMHISEATEKLGQPVIPNAVLNKILTYLPQLQNFNEDLLKDLSDRVQTWDDNPCISDIFVKKGPFLKLYSSYIRNFDTANTTLDEAVKKYPYFAAALKEFELSSRCNSLAVKHYMLKPIQRIPQYKLLLQEYLKQLYPTSADFKDTITALKIVSEVADHANESMRHGDNVQKLLEVQRSLVGSFEVIQPGRVLVMQGELEKVSRKEKQPRVFYLFNDVLLYTTPVTTGNKINNILPLIGMKVISPKLEDNENEFNIISVQRSFTLCAQSPELKDEWVSNLQKAIDENTKRHNTFESVKQGPETSLLDKDFVLGHKAPLWVPDARVTMCMLCLVEFTLTWRRHHCRSCGMIICSQCSQNKAPLKYLKYKTSRVCDKCFDKLHEEYRILSEMANEAGMEKFCEKKKKTSIKSVAEEESSTSITEDGISTTSNSSNTRNSDAQGDAAAELDNGGGNNDAGGISLSSLLSRFTKIRSSNTRHQRKSGNFRPSVLKEVRANDEGSDMSGYLYTFKSRKWKKMWFVLKGNVLYTYRASADMAAIESMPLLGYEVLELATVFEGVEPGLLFELRHQNNQPLTSSKASAAVSRGLTAAERAAQRQVLKTDSAAATSKWVAALQQASMT